MSPWRRASQLDMSGFVQLPARDGFEGRPGDGPKAKLFGVQGETPKKWSNRYWRSFPSESLSWCHDLSNNYGFNRYLPGDKSIVHGFFSHFKLGTPPIVGQAVRVRHWNSKPKPQFVRWPWQVQKGVPWDSPRRIPMGWMRAIMSFCHRKATIVYGNHLQWVNHHFFKGKSAP